MIRLAFFALASVHALASVSMGAIITSDIGVAGDFNATLGGSGTASLTSASGNFRQWLLFTHANIGVSAPPQTVGLNIPSVTPPTMSANGTIGMDYDNLTPGTPTQINSASLDLNGSQNIPFLINVSPIQLNTSLGNFNLLLTVNGTISSISFQSNASSLVVGGNGGSYDIPGEFSIVVSAVVTGALVNVPIIGNVNLGTIFTLPASVATFEGSLPGNVTTTDLDGGLAPFPNDMLANYQAVLSQGIQVPLDLPIAVNQTATIPNGQSGFSSLNVQGAINATLDLSGVSYDLDGVVQLTLVPEPASSVMVLVCLTGALSMGRRRFNIHPSA